MFFENKAADSQEPYFIKRTADSYTSEEYRCNWVLDDNRKLLGVKYNHHEEITVPKELFIGENGKITFRVKVDDINNEREDAKYISAISFLYEVKGTTVVINRVYDSAARYTLIK